MSTKVKITIAISVTLLLIAALAAVWHFWIGPMRRHKAYEAQIAANNAQVIQVFQAWANRGHNLGLSESGKVDQATLDAWNKYGQEFSKLTASAIVNGDV